MNSTFLEKEAAAALGGPPVMPPVFKTQPVDARPRPDAGVVTRGEEARKAFATQSVAAASASPRAFGNPTFDGPPPELAARRGKAEVARRRLANLAGLISAEQSALGSLLDDLADDAEELKAAEHFDVATARKFLADLAGVVSALSAPAADPKPAKKSAK